jgi:hypothetical protein
MLRVDVATIASWSQLESHLERIAAFSLFDLDLNIYNKHPSILASNATLSQVRQ